MGGEVHSTTTIAHEARRLQHVGGGQGRPVALASRNRSSVLGCPADDVKVGLSASRTQYSNREPGRFLVGKLYREETGEPGRLTRT